MSFPVLYYADLNAKLVALLSETNRFDSVIFIFDGFRRYKFLKADLGIRSACDLLIANRGVLSLLNPLWLYYLYPLCERHTYSLDSLCGKVVRHHGHLPSAGECHVFIDKSKRHLTLLYLLDGEFTSIHRRLHQGVFRIKRSEFTAGYRASHWQEICRLLSDKKATKG